MSAQPSDAQGSDGVGEPWPVSPQDISLVEQALAGLLSGPYAKVSITIPQTLRDRLADRADDRGFSALVTDILAREERRMALRDFLDEMDEAYGPVTSEQLASAREGLEEMWQEVRSRSAQ